MVVQAVKNVLQINVRLSEGGAAGVARTLSSELRKRGIASPFAYGYASRGRSSPLESEYGATRITPAAVAAANRLLFPYLGDETSLRGAGSWSRLRRVVDDADVVHLHAVHSHIARVSDLLRVIADARKPVVWTLHDQWLFTGRCAQPGNCRLWEAGCPSCPNLAAYPSARIDRAATHWPRRREMLDNLRRAVPVKLVACAEWLAAEAAVAGLGAVETITNSVDEAFWHAATQMNAAPREADGNTRCLFVCRDLRDAGKVHWPTLRAIASIPHVALTVVGDNAPGPLPGATLLPSCRGRVELARIMTANDRLIFLSTVDYFPLTLAEGVTAGLTIDAVESAAAVEFAKFPGVRLHHSREELLRAVSGEHSAPARTTWLAEDFAPGRMTDQYLSVYNQVLNVGDADG